MTLEEYTQEHLRIVDEMFGLNYNYKEDKEDNDEED